VRIPIPLAAGALAAAAAALAAVAAPSEADARVSVVYDEHGPARTIFTSPGALTPARGGYRQHPGPGGVFAGEPDGLYSFGKVEDTDLIGLPAQGMADHIRAEIDASPSGVVGLDEIGNAWRDPKVRQTYKWVSVRGKRIKVASHNDVVATRHGYRIVRRAQVPPVPESDHPGVRLSEAMTILAGAGHPAGGSYADRVHVYVAPAMVTSIGEGRGEHFTLDKAGSKSVRPAWRGVMPALARAGGVWLEMYHGHGGAVKAKVWRNAPTRFGRYLARHGGAGLAQLHFLITGTTSAPAGARACGSPMSCQFEMARSTEAGRTVLANGPGAYRVGAQAGEWLAEYNRTFAD
jgi:hypothetical protein